MVNFLSYRNYIKGCVLFQVGGSLSLTLVFIHKILLDFRFSTIATKVKSCIKDTNDFLGKRLDLPEIPNGIILCTIDVVELYPLNPSEEGLHSLKEAVDKTVSTVSLTTSLNLMVGSENRKKVPLRELNLLSLICSWLL